MNDSISVTLSTAMPTSPLAAAGSTSMAGLNGLFGQLLSLSIPATQGAAVDGQPLPTTGIALPLDMPEAGQQLASALERFTGDTLPEGFLTQLRQQGLNRENLTELADLLEQSDIASMPAVEALVSDIRSTLQEMPQAATGVADSVEVAAEDASAEQPVSEDAEQPPVTSAERSPVAEQRPDSTGQPVVVDRAAADITAIGKPEVGPAVDERQRAQASVDASLSSTAAETSKSVTPPVRPLDVVEPVTRTVPVAGESSLAAAQAAVNTAPESVSTVQAIDTAPRQPSPQPARPVAPAQPGAAAETTPVVAETGGAQSESRPVLPQGQRILNTDMAELARVRQQQAERATGTLQSDAEQLMARLTDAAQKGRSGTAAGVLQGMTLPDSRAAQVAQGVPSSMLEGRASLVQPTVTTLSEPVGSATTAAAPAPVMPQGQPGAPVASAVPAQSATAEQLEAARNAMAAVTQNTEASADTQARREPVQLVNPETRVTPDNNARPGGPAFAVTPVVDTDSAGGDLARDSGGRDDGRGREQAAQQAAVQSTTARAEQSQQAPHQLYMTGRPALNSPAWSSTLGNQIVWLASQNNKVAEIQLDPPELGSLQVKIRVSQDQVSVSFVSPHAAVRDTVEQSMARLREMFEEQGLNLADATVDDQSAQQHAGGEMADDQQGQQGGGAAGNAEAEDATVLTEAHTVSLVDYYA